MTNVVKSITENKKFFVTIKNGIGEFTSDKFPIDQKEGCLSTLYNLLTSGEVGGYFNIAPHVIPLGILKGSIITFHETVEK